jgi:hypothetical protein
MENSQAARNNLDESSMMTSSPCKTSARHPFRVLVIDPQKNNFTCTIHEVRLYILEIAPELLSHWYVYLLLLSSLESPPLSSLQFLK